MTPRNVLFLGNSHTAAPRIALRDDLAHARSLISHGGAPDGLSYLAGFLEGLGRAASDGELYEAGRALRCALATGPEHEVDRLNRLLTARLAAAGDLDRLIPER